MLITLLLTLFLFYELLSHYYQGPVRINPRNYEEAYVAHPDGQSDIYVAGLKMRNRALNGDWVAVFMEPRDKWRVSEYCWPAA